MAQSTSSSSRASRSAGWRSLIARCNAREKRQRLCSVILSWSLKTGFAKRQSRPNERHHRRRAEMLHSLLQAEIEQIGQNTIAVFALHKCGDSDRFSDHLMVMAGVPARARRRVRQ